MQTTVPRLLGSSCDALHEYTADDKKIVNLSYISNDFFFRKALKTVGEGLRVNVLNRSKQGGLQVKTELGGAG